MYSIQNSRFGFSWFMSPTLCVSVSNALLLFGYHFPGSLQNVLPDILCVIHVALEGKISKKSVMKSMSQGSLPQGDLLPWTIGQQFQDSEFPSLSGVRIIRIAVHPELGHAGYGTR